MSAYLSQRPGTSPASELSDSEAGGEVCDEVEVEVADEGPKAGCWHSERTGVQGHLGLQQEKQQNPSSPLDPSQAQTWEFWPFWLGRRSGGSSTQGAGTPASREAAPWLRRR